MIVKDVFAVDERDEIVRSDDMQRTRVLTDENRLCFCFYVKMTSFFFLRFVKQSIVCIKESNKSTLHCTTKKKGYIFYVLWKKKIRKKKSNFQTLRRRMHVERELQHTRLESRWSNQMNE